MKLPQLRRITRDGKWIPEIDGLRFIAIASVYLFHIAGETVARAGHPVAIQARYSALTWIISNFDRGVRLFFVISGFILALPFARHLLAREKPVSLRKFYLRRVTRLEPPYILSVILFTVLFGVYSHGITADFLRHALASLFYLHNLIYADISPVNMVTWSLEVEIQFYLLAPLFMQVFRIPGKHLRRTLLALAILGIGLLQGPVLLSARGRISIAYYVQYFLAGLLLADIYVLDLAGLRESLRWDAIAVLVLAAMYGLPHDALYAHIALPLLLPFLCLAALKSMVFRKIMRLEWVAVLGGMCYSIYLMHLVLVAVLFKVTRRLVVFDDYVANLSTQVLVLTPPVLLLCITYFVLIERPCMDPHWPVKLWHRLTGRSGAEVAELDTAGIS